MSCTYEVRVTFVDSTYWDDGSRWTSRAFEFKKRSEAIEFAKNTLKNGCKVRGLNGELFVRPEERDIVVERRSSTLLKWASE